MKFPTKKLVKAFQERFGGDVEFDSEIVGGVERFSFYLVSPKFKGTSPLKRQDAAWDVVNSVLSREEILHVSAIFPLVPSEVRELASWKANV
jgi:acid stress-induced BolA-like protein IbaG/YrbA